ncbi:MAG: UDP-3-O-acyl-N-acetylglucosamine deacetylase [Planctomycetia bacterium]|nr:UDP-3-O-acyl-N-acetylglucosamine deacetylase [Planctomycetia bacterium]
MRKQNTIANSVYVDGFGFWSGQDVRMEFQPAPENSGIRFFRSDLPDSLPIPALVEFRIDKPRQTSLRRGDAQVDMIEHVMSALKGLQIDNCDIRINGSEIPGFDGSGTPFFNALMQAGIAPQKAQQPYRIIDFTDSIGSNDTFIEVRPALNNEVVFGYSLLYDSVPNGEKHPIADQSFSFELTPDSFEKEIMRCRTFLLLKEAEYLLSKGLCTRVSANDVLVFGDEGPVENTLLFENECARHKTLDMIGDFALAGCDWIGNFHAHKTGHLQNAQAVLELCKRTKLNL